LEVVFDAQVVLGVRAVFVSSCGGSFAGGGQFDRTDAVRSVVNQGSDMAGMLPAMPDSKYRGRRKGVPIRAEAVRRARQEAGLSLADVAGASVSRTAIHYIEIGRTRPSWETLRLIARRTRKPIDYFLSPTWKPEIYAENDKLNRLEELCAAHRFREATEVARKLLEKRLDTDSQALVHFYLGQALCRLVEPVQALPYLGQARERFRRTGDQWMLVEAMDWESSALGLLEDPAALDLALDTLRLCRELNPEMRRSESRILGHIANMYVVSESWTRAASFYKEALEAAGDVRDLNQMAKMHHGLGTVLQRLGKTTDARQHFENALSLYRVGSDLASQYRVENDLGLLLLEQGHLDSAEAHLLKALKGCDELGMERRGRGFVLVNLGQLKLRRGDLIASRSYLLQALETANAIGERIVQADSHSLLGELAELQGDSAATDSHFSAAIATLTEVGMPDRLRECHMKYAEILESRQDLVAAAKNWKAAAETARIRPARVESPIDYDRKRTSSA
jgi:tetratricopeptide (TPR) repeat protein